VVSQVPHHGQYDKLIGMFLPRRLVYEISYSIYMSTTFKLTAALGSPLFLVKARIQAYSPAFPVGAQHYYKSSWDAIRTILKSDGVLGLWRGVNSAILRTAMVSRSRIFVFEGKAYTLPWHG
jgi:hypothetical protein